MCGMSRAEGGQLVVVSGRIDHQLNVSIGKCRQQSRLHALRLASESNGKYPSENRKFPVLSYPRPRPWKFSMENQRVNNIYLLYSLLFTTSRELLNEY